VLADLKAVAVKK